MTYQEYEAKAITTRVYSPKVAIPYVALGLLGEIGELHEKIQAAADLEMTKKEVGDILWYLAALRVELGLDVSVEDWNSIAQSPEVMDPFDLVVQAGIIAEQTKKYLRDDWKEDQEIAFPEERKRKIEGAWNEILIFIATLATSEYFNLSSIEEIASDNIVKLAKRAETNQIHGSGDVR